ncbi:transposase [Micromonospora sp. NPDC023633]|uniref:transposase n=1 Tax=Micromonospora sp. NPDC023633 TaxID=3154320 RepID=UPI0033C32434
MLAGVRADADAAGDVYWLVSVDPRRALGTWPTSGPPGPRHRRQGLPAPERSGLACVGAAASPAACPTGGIGHTIPERADQQANRRRQGSHGGRPSAFDKQRYKRRNVVERRFDRLEQCRSVATRYDKTATSYQATVTIAALLQWW